MTFKDWILNENIDYDLLDKDYTFYWFNGKDLDSEIGTNEWLGFFNQSTEK